MNFSGYKMRHVAIKNIDSLIFSTSLNVIKHKISIVRFCEILLNINLKTFQLWLERGVAMETILLYAEKAGEFICINE